MAAYSGWFASVTDQSTLDTPIPGFGSDEVWTLDGTVIAEGPGENVRWLQSSSSTTYFVYGQSVFEMVKDNSKAAAWGNVGGRTEDEPVHILLEGDGSGDTTLTMDGEPEGKQQGGSLWSIHHLNGAVGNDTKTGYLEIRDSSGTPVVQLSGNMVLAADDDGSQTSFVSRTAADADPSLAKEANYTNRLYDISGNGHNVTLQGNVNWVFKSEVVLPDRLVSGDTNVPFSVPSGTEVTDVVLNGKSIDYTFDYATSAGRINAPSLGSSVGFPKFGNSVEIKVIDSINNTESTKNIEWVPEAPYTFAILETNNTSDAPQKAYFNWEDPPVITDVAVFDPEHYSINNYAKLTVKENAPASFAVTEYVIDDDGIQSFERNSGTAEQVGELPEITLNGSATVTVTEGAGYTDEGADWNDAEDGTGTVYSDTVIDDQTTAGSYTLNYSYTDTDGNTASASRSVTVTAAANNPPTVDAGGPRTITVPDTVQLGTNVTAIDSDGSIASYAWTQESGPNVSINNAGVKNASVSLTDAGTYVFRVTVTDNEGATAFDDLTVTANEAVTDSTLNLTVTGIGTGSRSVVLHDRTTREVVYTGAITFTNDVGSVTLTDVAVGTEIYGVWFGTNPPVTGTGLYGVTE